MYLVIADVVVLVVFLALSDLFFLSCVLVFNWQYTFFCLPTMLRAMRCENKTIFGPRKRAHGVNLIESTGIATLCRVKSCVSAAARGKEAG